jgi:hypothetical protein
MLEPLPGDPAKLAKFVIDLAAGEIESEVRGPHRADLDAPAAPQPPALHPGSALDRETRIRIIQLLCEGHSLREAAALSGASEQAVGALMTDAGDAAGWYQERVLRHLVCRRIRLDAVVTFADDVWTWTAADEETGLILCWRVGARDDESAIGLVKELVLRLAHPVKLVDDRFNAYLEALEGAPDGDIDVAILRKLFGEPPQANARPEAASAEIARHARAVALFALYHNFVRIRRGPLTAPAAAAGVIEKPWTIANIVDVLEIRERLKTGPWYERLVVLKGR